MKNLLKLLPLILLPFFSTLESKAQASDSEYFNFEKCVSEIPSASVAPEFANYQTNSPDTIRYYYYKDRVNPNISYQDILLNIDEDDYLDVQETYLTEEINKEDLVNGNLDSLLSKGYVLTEDSTKVRTEHPWGYAFYPGPQSMYYYQKIEILPEPDGLNGNELSLEKIKECFDKYKESVFSREELEENSEEEIEKSVGI